MKSTTDSDYDPLWQLISAQYEVIEIIGSGCNCRQVVRAKRISDGVDVAIKLMKNVFSSDYASRQLFSEIHILRKLTQSRGSPFVT